MTCTRTDQIFDQQTKASVERHDIKRGIGEQKVAVDGMRIACNGVCFYFLRCGRLGANHTEQGIV